MNNYRLNVKSAKFNIDYWKNFSSLREYLPIVEKIKRVTEIFNIQKFWFFFEPHLEITWLSNNKNESLAALNIIKNIIKAELDENAEFEYKTPSDGSFGDWFCENEQERSFGAVRHSICCDWVLNYLYYKDAVDNGKGLENQVKRTIHTLCNPLGINYLGEAKICFSRGLICLLFKFFPFKRAVWIYKNIFCQDY